MAEVLSKSAQGELRDLSDNSLSLYRAVVVAVDVVGGKLENKKGVGKLHQRVGSKSYDVNATIGPDNPKNSVKARLITDGLDRFVHDDDIRTFWPFFPEHVSIPVKPGEYVYVMFEDNAFQHGLWLTKVPGHENVNVFKGSQSLTSSKSGSLMEMFSDTRSKSDTGERFDTDEAATESKRAGGLMRVFYPGI